jgi:hypothetical protein
LSAAPTSERPDSKLRGHHPHETPRQRFLQRLAGDVLLVWRMERHHPARVVDGPGARAAAGGDRAPEGILEATAFSRRIDSGMRNRAGEIRGEDRTIARVHQRCSISQSTNHPSQNAPITASVVTKASTNRRDADVGRRTRTSRGSSATAPAKSSSGTGRVQLMRVRYQTALRPRALKVCARVDTLPVTPMAAAVRSGAVR